MNSIKIVIGSWGSYNTCNERALSSKWLDLSDYSDWDEIAEKLKKEGFQLDGIDEELFVQDVDGIESSETNWDYVNPQKLFETLQESEVLDDEYKNEVFQAYLETHSLDDFMQLVDKQGCDWNDNINLYRRYDWEDYGREMFDNCHYQVEDSLLNFFDFERYGEAMGSDCADVYSSGIIEII